MRLRDLLGENAGDSVVLGFKAGGKNDVLYEIASRVSRRTGLRQDAALEALKRREALAATSFGGGVAIPHARPEGLEQPVGVFIRLEKPLRDWRSLEAAPSMGAPTAANAPVDLVFALFSPATAGAEHLKALARISRALRGSQLRENLRGALDAEGAWLLLTQEAETSRAA